MVMQQEQGSIKMEDVGKLILRVTTAGLILFHGTSKLLHGIGFIENGIAGHHLPRFIAYGVFIGEVFAPMFLLVGLWTRIAALIVAFNMIVAVLLTAYHNAFVIQRSGAWGLEAEAFFFLTAICIFFIGGGKLSATRGRGALN